MTTRCTLSILVLALAGARLASAQDFGKPLTQAQVDCEERQLMRLLHRTSVDFLGSHVFLWRSSPAGGAFGGLAASSSLLGDAQDETTWTHEEEQLAFDLILKKEGDFLNPQRALLPQATLVRRDAASNLSSLPDTVPLLDVRIDLAPEVIDPFTPVQPLRITNRLLPGAGHDDRAGRALASDAFLTACHSEVSDFDLKIFAILARTVRASDCLFYRRSGCPDGLYPFKAVLFRGTEPLTYRMNVLRYGDTCFDECVYLEGGAALLFRFRTDDRGNLTGG